MRRFAWRATGRRPVRAAAVALACAGVTSYVTMSSAMAAAPKKPTPIRIATIPAFGSLPLEVAMAKGYFARNGLKATLTPVQSPPAQVAALGSQFDVGMVSPQTVFAARSQGLQVAILTGMQAVSKKAPNSVLIAGSPITSLKQLEGKRVGVISISGGSAQALEYELLKAGVPLSSVTIIAVPVANMPDEIKAGTIYAAVSAVPFFTNLGSDIWVGKTDLLQDAIQRYTGGKQTTAYSATTVCLRKWAAAHPGAVKAFRTALAEADAWMYKNKAAARALLSRWTGVPASIANAAPFPDVQTLITVSDVQAQLGLASYVGQEPTGLPQAASMLVPGSATPITLSTKKKKKK